MKGLERRFDAHSRLGAVFGNAPELRGSRNGRRSSEIEPVSGLLSPWLDCLLLGLDGLGVPWDSEGDKDCDSAETSREQIHATCTEWREQ
jgi:hypothetical protein